MDFSFVTILASAAAVLVAVLVLFIMLRGEQLLGRLRHMAEGQNMAQIQLSERLQAQERTLAKLLDDRLTDVAKRLSDGLDKSTTRTTATMTDIQKRLAVIDAAQKNINELSTQMVGLQDILANKQARGVFGEIQLNDLVRNALPPSAYAFQVQLTNGRRVDCLLNLPNPPGAIAIDSKFPLESFHALAAAKDDAERSRAGKAFGADILKHVNDIAERYIVPGETAESALMFLPAEAVYAELHANFPGVVERSYRKRVWIVSPTTLMATLNTVRAVLKDATMREQAHVIQKEVLTLMGDVGRLDKRVESLKSHFKLAGSDIHDIQISSGKITSRSRHIEEIELGAEGAKGGPAGDLEPPHQQIASPGD